MTGARPRLVIADDHRVVVQGLQQLLGGRFDIVGVAYAGDELLRLLEGTAADGLLLDLSLPGRNGLDILPDIRALQPDLKVLVLTMHADRVLAEASIAAGA
ncbi:MAG TPA: response regulator transcription factor, partial [Gemmatimonadales bacterium]|nr:response regulator transcription factor [Gemmatimonadales bacterium]